MLPQHITSCECCSLPVLLSAMKLSYPVFKLFFLTHFDLMSMKSWQQMCILIGHAVKQPVAHAKPHVLSFFLARTIGEAHGLTL